MSCTTYQYYSGVQIRKNEMGGACGTYGRQDRYLQGVCCGELREDNLEDLEIEERILLERWPVVVNKAMTLSLKTCGSS
jgi:hypothetical protein